MTTTTILVLQTGVPVERVQHARGSFVQDFDDALHRHDNGSSTVRVTALDATARAPGDAHPSWGDVHGVIVTGSPAYVGDDEPWMRWTVDVVREAVAREVPFLGVCFGHQLLGVATGSVVGENPRGREMGTVDVTLHDEHTGTDPLFAPQPRTFGAQVTHRDVILSPSSSLRVLGTTAHDPHHVVRAGRVAWGVQFHPEFDDDILRMYLEERGATFDAARGAGSASARISSLRATPEAASLLPRFASIARQEAQRRG